MNMTPPSFVDKKGSMNPPQELLPYQSTGDQGSNTIDTIGAVDLFCGAGGLSLGLKQAGISVRAGIDLDPNCRFPFEKNIGSTFHEMSVRNIDTKTLSEMWGSDDVRLLAGCAPCQPFSSQRRGAVATEHESWDLLLEFGRLIEGTLPDYVTMENVSRLRTQNVFRSFLDIIVRNNYYVDYQIIKAEQYGLPQRRRRLVLIAARYSPIHIPAPKTDQQEVTVSQAFSGLPPLKAGEQCPTDTLHRARRLSELNLARIRASNPGGTWLDWPPELRAPCHRKASGSTFGSFYGVMAPNEPSPTITTEFYNYGSGRFGHPSEFRTITPREAALLQGFPSTYEFTRPEETVHFTKMGRMIGNAVPPILGQIVGTAIISHRQTLSTA